MQEIQGEGGDVQGVCWGDLEFSKQPAVEDSWRCKCDMSPPTKAGFYKDYVENYGRYNRDFLLGRGSYRT